MKALATLVLACSLVFAIGHYAVFRAQELHNARLEHSLVDLQNKTNEAKVASKALPLFREDVARLEQEADRWLSPVSAASGISEVLSHLAQLGKASGVTLERFAGPSSPTAGERSETAVITVRGSRRHMLAFFAALRGDMYPFTVGDLKLFAVRGTAHVLQADLTVASLLGVRGDPP